MTSPRSPGSYLLAALVSIAAFACGSGVSRPGVAGASVAGASVADSGVADSGVGSRPDATNGSAATKAGAKSCARGVYAEPGCPDAPPNDIEIEAGCYEPCSTLGAACINGGICRKAWIDPCVCEPHPNDPDEGCCDACGGEQLLCMK